jgi:hypothetical protein
LQIGSESPIFLFHNLSKVPKYIVHVELGNYATSQHYTQLHAVMEKLGFDRTIFGRGHVKYHLPTAEYYIISAYTPEALTILVYNTAKQIDPECAVLTTEADNIWWDGLKKA